MIERSRSKSLFHNCSHRSIMCLKFLIRFLFIFTAAPKLVLNTVLDPQSSIPGSGLSFDNSVLSHNGPDINPIDTKDKVSTESGNQGSFETNVENASDDTGTIVLDSENSGTLLANTDPSSLDSTYVPSISSGRDSFVSNDQNNNLMSEDGCDDSNTKGDKRKRGWDLNPFHWSIPWERKYCPFVDTSPLKPKPKLPDDQPLDDQPQPKKPKEPSRNPTYVNAAKIPVINGGTQFGGERSCHSTRPPRLKTLICGGPALPHGVIPAQIVQYCFSCKSFLISYSACTPHFDLISSNSNALPHLFIRNIWKLTNMCLTTYSNDLDLDMSEPTDTQPTYLVESPSIVEKLWCCLNREVNFFFHSLLSLLCFNS